MPDGRTSLRDALAAIREASSGNQLNKLLSYNVFELAMVGAPQQGRAHKEFEHFEDIVAMVEDATGERKSPGQIAQWLRDSGAPQLASRF